MSLKEKERSSRVGKKDLTTEATPERRVPGFEDGEKSCKLRHVVVSRSWKRLGNRLTFGASKRECSYANNIMILAQRDVGQIFNVQRVK